MRTRFLDIDYFATENLSFPGLHVPHLASKPVSTFGDLLHLSSVPEISLGIDASTIDSALSRFLDDVLPHRIDDDHKGDIDARCQDPGERIFSSGSAENRLLEKDNGTDTNNRDLMCNVIQFETPQLDAFLDNIFLSGTKQVQLLSVSPEVELNLENLSQGLLTYPSEIKESVYAVEGITSEYLVDQKCCLLENTSVQDQKLLYKTTFPFLEVDEMVLETLACLSLENELLFLLENTESPHKIPNDKFLVNTNEYLCSMKYDIEEFLSAHFLQTGFDSELAFPDFYRESELIGIMKTLEIPENSSVQNNSGRKLSIGPPIFEEFLMLHIYLNQPFEVFFDLEISNVTDSCDWMFSKDMNFKSFDELVVCHELAMEDDTFKSLPVPILSNQGTFRSLHAFIEEKLANLNGQPLFASDGIYLDWHLLEENNCNSRIYYSYKNMLEEISLQPINFDQEPCENDSIFYGYVFSDDALIREKLEENGELKEFFSDGIDMSCQTIKVASNKLLNERCPEKGSEDFAALVENTEKASLSWKSISEFNDLEFFLNPQKPAGVRKDDSVVSATETNTMFLKVTCTGPLTDQTSTSSGGVSQKKCDFSPHQVCLSDKILHLINNSEKTYLSILQNEVELRKRYLPYLAEDHFLMLSLPKKKLTDCIKQIYLQGTTSYLEEKVMTLATLYAIKQIAWYLCFYGIHPAHLYLNKLCQRLECLKSRLGFLVSLIEEADRMVSEEIIISHPALTTIQKILFSEKATKVLKVLVVANQIFWWSLKKLFVSMGLSFEELNDQTPANQRVSNANILVDDLLVSNCLLVSQEKISMDFPFNKFSIILEYGGPNGSSQISSHLSKLVDSPHLHFVMLELDKSGNCKAFCEGVDIPQHNKLKIEEKSFVENNSQMLEKLLNFLPVEEQKYNLASLDAVTEVEDCSVSPQVPVVPLANNSQHIDRSVVSVPKAIVIVNTQNSGKEMIISRRSSYQRILALEKEGVQVVERDLSLPVDLIISSATCLIWYDCTNIPSNASTSREDSSCIIFCIENIATDVLTSLSYTFSGCVLVFEGDTSFLSAVMESSDGLYAAAASLEIDFQLFCSYSSELTDEIILGCIENNSKLTRGLYSKIPESESLAESFLTSFPSINPLTAHAILSFESTLIEFIEWSHERRLHEIQKYCIPDISVSLFSVLCKYGEKEDSKSVMTDCSSSVSSGPDSGKSQFKVHSERKRRKFPNGPYSINKNMDFMNFDQDNPYNACLMEPSSVSKPFGSQIFKDPEILCDLRRLSAPVNPFFDQNDNLDSFDAAMMMDPISVCKPFESWISKAPEVSDKTTRHSLDVKSYVQNQGLDSSKRKIGNWDNVKKPENQHEELIGEVIDLTDSNVFNNDFPSTSPMNFLPTLPDHEIESSRKSKIQRRLSYGQSSHPTSADIMNYSTPDMSSLKLHKQSSQGLANIYSDPNFKTSVMPLRYKDDLKNKGLMQNSVRYSKLLSLSEDISHSDVTPLSNALRSDHLQESSPWTMEFLNRIREKSRNRQQSLLSDSSSPFLENSGNVKRAVKRRSPSILEFFKYQGGSTLRKKPEQKKQKQKQSIKASSSSKNGLVLTSELSSWTPIDKRARQTLSFANGGNGSQTKLVWSDGNYGPSKSFQKLGNK